MVMDWCPTCRSRQEVVETDTTDTGDRWTTVEVHHLTRLACGHTLDHTVGTSPSPLQEDGDLGRAYDLGEAW